MVVGPYLFPILLAILVTRLSIGIQEEIQAYGLSRRLMQVGRPACANKTALSTLYTCNAGGNVSTELSEDEITVCVMLCGISVRQIDKCIPCQMVSGLCRQELGLKSGWVSPEKVGDFADIACTVPAVSDFSLGIGGIDWGGGDMQEPIGPDSLSDLSGTGDQALNQLLLSYYTNQTSAP
eukprot:jgi/Botrbrau1/13487/Bobra.0082s0083.1